jgi:hypothetical protein
MGNVMGSSLLDGVFCIIGLAAEVLDGAVLVTTKDGTRDEVESHLGSLRM